MRRSSLLALPTSSPVSLFRTALPLPPRRRFTTCSSRAVTNSEQNRKKHTDISTVLAQLAAARAQQQLTDKHPLEDTFGRQHNYLRISLTERCNLRCTYCMPEQGVDLTPNEELLTAEEIARLARIFVEQGVTKIRFTGGEPTVRRDLEEIIHGVNQLRAIGLQSISLTTNGIVLSRALPGLVRAGLNNVNISLDTLDPFQFELITRRRGHDRVLRAIDDALASGLRSVKVNAVVIRGINENQLPGFVNMTRDKNLEVRFIEYMPFDDNRWSDTKFFSYKEMMQVIKDAGFELQRMVDETKNEVAKTWHVPGFQGRVGFITSMSEHFCSTCNRVRMTADGNFKVCLFGATEVSLRDFMRGGASDEDLRDVISLAILRKKKRHAGMFELAKMKNRPMITIGG